MGENQHHLLHRHNHHHSPQKIVFFVEYNSYLFLKKKKKGKENQLHQAKGVSIKTIEGLNDRCDWGCGFH